MKSENGVTLISVTVYVIAMLIVVAVIAVLTTYFYKNIDINSKSNDINKQYTKFSSYFTEEVNKRGNKILALDEYTNESTGEKQQYIVFSSGNQYTFIKANKGIYLNNVKIATNIENCTFTQEEKAGKTTIKVEISGQGLHKSNTYTLVQ